MGKNRSKQTKLEMTVTALRQRYGSRAVFTGEARTTSAPASAVPHISTGFSALDDALRIGGLPKGRIGELTGQPTSGKTTLALKFLEQAQNQDRQVGYVDQARYFDPDYAHRCGLDLSRLVVGTPYDPSETLAMVEALVHSGSLAALVLDTPDFFWSGAHIAHQLNASLNRLLSSLAKAGTALLFLHDPLASASSPLSIVAHYASVRLDIVRERWQRSHGDIRGYQARVEVLKNRFGSAGRAATIAIQFNGTVRGDGL